MPYLFRKSRLGNSPFSHARKYLWYAVGEIGLIFVGITLALAFGDMQEQRRTRLEEIAALNDLARNLHENIRGFEETIGSDENYLEQCRDAIGLVEAKTPWKAEYGAAFEGCRFWTSPYLSRAAYDSLKAKGTDLISSTTVRLSIVNLYDGVYSKLIGDMDREQWDFQSTVVLPLWNRFLRSNRGQVEVSDYDALLESGEFLNMLCNRSELLARSIAEQKRSLSRTEEVNSAIEAELLRLAAD